MTVRVTCPNPACGAVASVEEQSLGRRGRCKKCGHVFALARPDGQPASMISDDASAWKKGSAPASPTNLPEQFGRYRIMKTLGQGGMGAVYLAHDIKLDRQVALKVPYFAPADGPQAVQRFEREARAAATLDHPNLCPIFDVGEVDGVHYLTMPYIEGRTLADSLSGAPSFTEARAAAVARKLALALQEAHEKGIIHRDLKPGNIMLNRRGELIIMDFGLARVADGDDRPLTRTGHVLGTALYMAPEQAAGDLAAIGPGCDVYSLGVILHELLTGRRPFEGPWSLVIGLKNVKDPDPPSQHRPGLSPALDAICLKAIAREPVDRYATMAEFAAILKAFLASPALPSRPAEGSSPANDREGLAALALAGIADPRVDHLRGKATPPLASGRAWVIAATGVACALVVGVILYVVTGRSSAVPREDGPAPPVEAGPLLSGRPQAQESEPSPVAVPEGPAPDVDDTPITNTLGMNLRLIPAGGFLMGSDDSDPGANGNEKVEAKKHPVRITRPFYLGTTEVTVGQFRKFAEETKLEGDPEHSWRLPGFSQSDDHPVVNVSGVEALAFCAWLSKKEGQTYRLPTEAEWEYACRAGTTTRFWFGDDPEGHATAANFADATAQVEFPEWGDACSKVEDGFVRTAPVGRFRANPFGLHDMHGNAWEWCSDTFDWFYYAHSPTDDPLCNAKPGDQVVRGGSWDLTPRDGRSAHRGWHAPDYRINHTGFRALMVAGSAAGSASTDGVTKSAGTDEEMEGDLVGPLDLDLIPPPRPSAKAATPAAAAPRLVAFYDFDEGNAKDRSGQDHQATLSSKPPTFTTQGYQGGAMKLGSSQPTFLRIPVNINPDEIPQLTMGGWFNAEPGTMGGPLISHGDGGFDRAMSLSHSPKVGDQRWTVFNGSRSIRCFPATTGRWTFVAMRHDQATRSLILDVDGEAFRTKAYYGSGAVATFVGKHPGFKPNFEGKIDNIFIYNYCLEDDQVADIRRRGATAILAVTPPDQAGPSPAASTKPAREKASDPLAKNAVPERAASQPLPAENDPFQAGMVWSGKYHHQWKASGNLKGGDSTVPAKLTILEVGPGKFKARLESFGPQKGVRLIQEGFMAKNGQFGWLAANEIIEVGGLMPMDFRGLRKKNHVQLQFQGMIDKQWNTGVLELNLEP